jgi:hypothetical protein
MFSVKGRGLGDFRSFESGREMKRVKDHWSRETGKSHGALKVVRILRGERLKKALTRCVKFAETFMHLSTSTDSWLSS